MLTIAGDGELRPLVERAALHDPSLRYLGLVPADDVQALYARSALVVLPSLWPEPDPLSAIGALAAGRPVLACNVGALSTCITDSCGWLAEPSARSFSDELVSSLRSRDELGRRGIGAREEFVARRLGARVSARAVYEAVLSDAIAEMSAQR